MQQFHQCIYEQSYFRKSGPEVKLSIKLKVEPSADDHLQSENLFEHFILL